MSDNRPPEDAAARKLRVDRIQAVLDEAIAEAHTRGHNGYGPEDVERLVKEDRAEQRAVKQAAKKLSSSSTQTS